MKIIMALVIALWGTDLVFAQSRLSPDEVTIIEALRLNPPLFAQVLAQCRLEGASSRSETIQPVGYQAVGPRDAIDVSISGGRIAFYGRLREYTPVSFRIQRGEERLVTFAMDSNGYTVNKVRVAYRYDGLHFDIPAPYGEGETRGCIVIPEDSRWARGDSIVSTAASDSKFRSVSRAENLSFSVRYVSSRMR